MSDYTYYLDLAEQAKQEGDLETAKGLADVAERLMPKQEEETQPEPQEQGSQFGLPMQTSLSVAGGVGSAVTESAGFLDLILDPIADDISKVTGDVATFKTKGASEEELTLWENLNGAVVFDAFGREVKHFNYDQLQQLKQSKLIDNARLGYFGEGSLENVTESALLTNKDLKESGVVDSGFAQFTGGVTQFLAGWVTLGKFKKGAEATQTVTQRVTEATAKGFVVDTVAFDGHDANAADLVKVMGLEAEYLDWLTDKETDEEFFNRLKNGIAGGATGIALDYTIEGLIKGFRFVKSGKKSKDETLAPEEQAAAKEEAEVLDKELKDDLNPEEGNTKVLDEDGNTLNVETPETTSKKFEDETPEPKAEEPEVPLGKPEKWGENEAGDMVHQVDYEGTTINIIKRKDSKRYGIEDLEGFGTFGSVKEANEFIHNTLYRSNDVADMNKWQKAAKSKRDAEELPEAPLSINTKPVKVGKGEYTVERNGTTYNVKKVSSNKWEIEGIEGTVKSLKAATDKLNKLAEDAARKAKKTPVYRNPEFPITKVNEDKYQFDRSDGFTVYEYDVIKNKDGKWELIEINGNSTPLPFKNPNEAVDYIDSTLLRDDPDKLKRFREHVEKRKEFDQNQKIEDLDIPNIPDYTRMSKDELDIITKEARAKFKSLRSPDDTGTKTIPVKKSIAQGRAYITKLLKEQEVTADILDFVKQLTKEKPHPSMAAAFTKGVQDLQQDIVLSIRLIEESTAYKKGDPNAVAKKRMLTKAYLELHTVIEGLGSSWARALQALRVAITGSKPRDLSSYFGEDLARAQDKMVDKAAKAAQKEIDRLKKGKNLSEDDLLRKDMLEESGIEVSPEDMTFINRIKEKAGSYYSTTKKGLDMTVEFATANLLTSIDTQLINVIANSVMTIVNNIETGAGAGVALLRGDVKAAKRQWRRGYVQMFGVALHSRRALSASAEVIASGKNILDPDFKVKEEVRGAKDSVSIGKGDIDLRDIREKIKNQDWDELKDIPIGDWIGNFVRIPFRGLAAGDEFFKQVNFRSVYMGLVDARWQQAGKHQDEGMKEYWGLVKAEVDNSMNLLKKYRDGEEALTEQELTDLGEVIYALQQSRQVTFTDKLGGFGQWIQKGVNQFPLARLIMDAWFIRTPTNVFKFGLRRFPVTAVFSRRFHEAMKRGGDDRDRALAEMVMMTTAVYTAWNFINEKEKVPDGKGGEVEIYKWTSTMDHTSYNHQKNLKLAGVAPHSYYHEGKFYTTSRFDPADVVLMTLANTRDLVELGKYEEANEILGATVVSFMNLAKDKTFTQGIANFVEMTADPINKGGKYLEAKGRVFTPSVLKMIGEDEVYREVNGVIEAMQSQIPTLSPNLQPKFDRLGQVMNKPDKGLSNVTLLSDNPVRLEFLKMNSNISDIPKQRGILDLEAAYFYKDGKSAWTRFNEIYSSIEKNGLTLEERIAKYFKSSKYQKVTKRSLSTPERDLKSGAEKDVMSILSDYERYAMKKLLKEYEDTGLAEVYEVNRKLERNAQREKTVEGIITDPEEIIANWRKNNRKIK